jgi:hypothetical protein
MQIRVLYVCKYAYYTYPDSDAEYTGGNPSYVYIVYLHALPVDTEYLSIERVGPNSVLKRA